MSPDDSSLDNSTIDDILAAMGGDPEPAEAGGPPADQSDGERQSDDEPSPLDDTGASEIGEPSVDSQTAPADDSTSEELGAEIAERAALEAMLTEVEEEPAEDEVAVAEAAAADPEPEKTEKEAETTSSREGPAPVPVAAPAVMEEPPAAAAPAAHAQRAGKGTWLLAALFALNTIAILILAGKLASFRMNQQNHFDRLIGVLQEDLQARRATVKKQGTDDILAYVEEAGRLFDSAQYGLALPLLQKASKALPGRRDLLWKLAMSAMHLGRWHKAAETLTEFGRRFPDNEGLSDALMHTGQCYKELGLYGRARKTYYKLIGLSGRFTEAQQQLIPAAYAEIADCYRLQALSVQTRKAER